MTDARTEKLLRAYDQERQDERTYWWTISTLMLTAIAAVLVLISADFAGDAWGVWLATPFVAALTFSYYVYQSAIGARRRFYLEALERELSKGENDIEIKGFFEARNVRLLYYNRYSWSLTGLEKEVAPQLEARILFAMMVAIPFVMLAAVDATACWRLAESGHPVLAMMAGVVSVAFIVFLIVAAVRLNRSYAGDPKP